MVLLIGFRFLMLPAQVAIQVILGLMGHLLPAVIRGIPDLGLLAIPVILLCLDIPATLPRLGILEGPDFRE